MGDGEGDLNSREHQNRLSLLRHFEVVAYGCNRIADDSIRRKLDGSVLTYRFLEYFVQKPLGRRGARDSSSTHLFFPFLRRFLYEDQFFLDPHGQDVPRRRVTSVGKLTPRIAADLKPLSRLGYWMPMKRAFFGRKLLAEWRKKKKTSGESTIEVDEWLHALRNDVLKPRGGSVTFERGAPLQPKGARDRDIQILEYNLTAWPWQACGDRTNAVFSLIASTELFYGYIVLLFPWLSERKDSGNRELRISLKVDLDDVATKVYRPVLAILHEGRDEHELRQVTKNIAERPTRRQGRQIDKCITGNTFAFGAGSDEVLEDAFERLWRRRQKLKAGRSWVQAELEKLEKTLLFDERFYASPRMVKIIQQIATEASSLVQPKVGKELPAALIYGEPGSGKEAVGEMIPLFTDDYFSADRTVVNVSAIKPDAAVGPLFMGVDAAGGFSNSGGAGFRLEGAFVRERKKIAKREVPPQVIVLDELNSLAVDYHGILLRVLEQGEVLPLFGSEAQYVRHLVIGIVNENPEMALRETEKELLDKSGSLLGEIARHLLRDAVLSGRKLRPDLYYRLIRSLYLEVPTLVERRDDIPILFFFMLRSGLKRLRKQEASRLRSQPGDEDIESFDVVVDFGVYDALREKGRPWKGNLRELQSVATKTAAEVAIGQEPRPEGELRDFYYVGKAEIKKVLAEMDQGRKLIQADR